MTTAPFDSTLRLRSPRDLLAAVPYLLGYHPADSVVAIGMRDTQLHFHMRATLPAPGASEGDVWEFAARFLDVLAPQGCDGVALVGYGPADRVDPAVRAVLEGGRFQVYCAYRATRDRFWSLCHHDPGGTPYDASASPVAAVATVAGLVAFPDRATLAATLAAPTGERLAAIEAATERARDRLGKLVTTSPQPVEDAMRAGRAAVARAHAHYAGGGQLTDDEVGWLTLLLTMLPVRDYAWDRVAHTSKPGWWAWEQLWTDVLSRCDPDFAAPPGVLLSYLMWRTGDGLRANIAVERAFTADPDYVGALFMAEVLTRALAPHRPDPSRPRPGKASRRRQAHAHARHRRRH